MNKHWRKRLRVVRRPAIVLIVVSALGAWLALYAIGRYQEHRLARIESWYKATLSASVDEKPIWVPLPMGVYQSVALQPEESVLVHSVAELFGLRRAQFANSLARYTKRTDEYLAKLESAVQWLRSHTEGRELPKSYVPNLTNDGASMVSALEVLRLRAFEAALRNDGEAIVQNYELRSTLFAYFARTPVFEEHVARLVGEERSQRDLRDLLAYISFDDSQLERLQSCVASDAGLEAAAIPVLVRAFAVSKSPKKTDGVEAGVMAVRQWCEKTIYGKGPWPKPIDEAFTRASRLFFRMAHQDAAARARYLEIAQYVAALFQRRGDGEPSHALWREYGEFHVKVLGRSSLSAEDLYAAAVFSNAGPNNDDINVLFLKCGEIDIVLVSLALERYRLTHGAYPHTIDTLSAENLGAIPPAFPDEWTYKGASQYYFIARKGEDFAERHRFPPRDARE